MKTCPDCGSRVYKLGCVNCDEAAYIAEQEIHAEQYGKDEEQVSDRAAYESAKERALADRKRRTREPDHLLSKSAGDESGSARKGYGHTHGPSPNPSRPS